MSDATWTRLSAPFGAAAVSWDVIAVDEDEGSALVAPRLTREALVERLDDVCGVDGWSLRLSAAGRGALVCSLEVGGVSKAAAVDGLPAGAAVTADAALAAAAWLYGMRPDAALSPRRVAYDAVAGGVLEGPDDVDETAGAAVSMGDGEHVQDLRELDARERGLSSEGQRMIDRLVERLKDEGEGLAAARLLVRFGGYGKDPEAARALYGALRALLKRSGEGQVAS